MKKVIEEIMIRANISIKEALRKIDANRKGALFVCDVDGVLLGALTDGDIRRRILGGGNLADTVDCCYNHDPVFVVEGHYTIDEIKRLMLDKTVAIVPVIDMNRCIIDILSWKDVFQDEAVTFKKIAVPVVIMAGGRGERLGPFTKILPKPLIPVGEKPIIEIIIDKFSQHGVNEVYLTLNYKGEMIKNYLESIEKNYQLRYIWEKDFLGTAGSLGLLPADIGDTFMVSNCDIIVDVNYADLLHFHRHNDNILTVVGAFQNYKIPYGIINFENEGKIKSIQEKPEFDLTVNTGMYVLSHRALTFIPENKPFDMTELVQVLLAVDENVGVYPVSQKSYGDVGQMEEYKKVISQL